MFEWLKAACLDDETSPIGAPFIATIKGQEWVIGSDGYRAAAALVEAFPDVTAIAKELGSKTPNIEAIMTQKHLETYETTAEELTEFCKPPETEPCNRCDKGLIKCRSCNGKGRKTHFCMDCDDGHECICQSCEDGFLDCDCAKRHKYPAIIRDRVIDRALIWDVMRHMSGPIAVRFGHPGEAIHFVGPGWVLLVMPITLTADKRAGLPVFAEAKKEEIAA